jgi:hypothetical protein
MQDVSLLYSVHTGSGVQPATSPMDTGGDILVGKAARDMKVTIHLHLVQQSRMVELYLHSLNYRDNFTINYKIWLLSKLMCSPLYQHPSNNYEIANDY